MKYLLNIEWLKYKHYKPFWLLTGLYALSIVVINYIVFKINAFIHTEESSPQLEMLIGKSAMAFPYVWESVSYASSFILSILGLLVILVTTNEYTFKTHRQNIIDGFSREQFITSKIISAVILSIVSTLIVTVTAIVAGLAEVNSSFTLSGSISILYFFIQTLSYTMLALLIATFFRRGAIAIGIYLLYIWMIEPLIMVGLWRIEFPYAAYLPIQSADDLISFPSFDNIKKFGPSLGQVPSVFFVPLIYVGLMVYFTYKRFVKSDL
ncbi:ABC transporter permease [Gynurincola endophyticus]|jgi:ABC-2 type transport system permease protein|uniref:ABC transporter permease n=1 Tax=Gynurincola endophyticus TaxID=2479004 RepID=UPI000F8E3DC2|nr:ABC transporter permease [Gynurincola endophyticus]